MLSCANVDTSWPSSVNTEPLPNTRPFPANDADCATSSHWPTSKRSWKCAVCEMTPVEIVRWASPIETASECGRMARPMIMPGWLQARIAWFAATESYDSGLRIQKYNAGVPSGAVALASSTVRVSTPGYTSEPASVGRSSGRGTSGSDEPWRMRSGSTVLSRTRPRESRRSPCVTVMVSLPHARPECSDSSCRSIGPALYEPARAKIAWIDFTSFAESTASSAAMIICARIWPLNTTSRPSGSSVGCGAE